MKMKQVALLTPFLLVALFGCAEQSVSVKVRPESELKRRVLMAYADNFSTGNFDVVDLEKPSGEWSSKLSSGKTYEEFIASALPPYVELRSNKEVIGEDIRSIDDDRAIVLIIVRGESKVLMVKEDFNTLLKEVASPPPME